MDPPIRFRKPRASDGPAIFELVAACPPLDPNSRYCNLLQCSYFADTCIVAESSQVVGFVSGFIPPGASDTLFIWQIAVAPSERGQGLARRLLMSLLHEWVSRGVSCLETTITPENKASWALFRGLAREIEASFRETLLFEEDAHFAGRHDDEYLVRIGPF